MPADPKALCTCELCAEFWSPETVSAWLERKDAKIAELSKNLDVACEKIEGLEGDAWKLLRERLGLRVELREAKAKIEDLTATILALKR